VPRVTRADAGRRDPTALGVQFDLLVNASPDFAVMTLSADGYVTSWNKGAEHIKGYTSDEILGRHFSVFFPPEDVASGYPERELQTAVRVGCSEAEGWRVRKDGSRFWANEVTTAIFEEDDGDLAGFGRVTRNMTERKRFVDELQDARDMSERASQAKDEFLSNMSHELRTPLNAVIGFAQVLQLDDLSPDQREAVEHIGEAGHHLLGLINEILDISRVVSGHLPISVEPINLAVAVGKAVALVGNLARPRGVRVTVEGNEETHVAADRQRLRQVIVNLASNAVKYNKPDGEVRITWAPGEPGRVRLAVSDTGRGIPADQLTRLYVPFDRLAADATGIEGTGLGLALSKALIEAMEGTIEVSSEPERGTTFTVDLPAAEPGTAMTEAAVAPPEARSDEPLVVLYLEDNLSNLQLVQHVFHARPNIELVPAMQAQIGLELARTKAPDLLLLDLNLPDLSGEEVLRQLQADPATADIPTVIMSADAEPNRIAALRALGIADYLTKPIDVTALLHLVDRSQPRRRRAGAVSGT
jgi:PAS domain S-box-containing protein